MGGEGEYIVYVGSLTVPLHNDWADAAIAYQKEKYPNMTAGRRPLRRRRERRRQLSRPRMDQMRANPDLKGILAFGCRARSARRARVEDRGKVAEQVALVGPFSPGQGAKYVKSRRDPRRLHLEPDDWPAR